MRKQKFDIKYIDTYIELFTDLVFIKNMKGEYTHCNNAYLEFFNRKKEEIIGKNDYDLLPIKNADKCIKDDQNVLKSTHPIDCEDMFTFKEQDIYFKTTKQLIYDNEEKLIGIITIARDITQIKQYQLLYEDNNALLEYMHYEFNTKKILSKIVEFSEKRNKNIKCSILLLDTNKEYLQHIHSSNLKYHWSEPIYSKNNLLLGTFTMHSDTQNSPNDFQLQLMTSYAHLTAISIEKEEKKVESDVRIRKVLEKQLIRKTKDLRLFKQVIDNINYGVLITTADGTNKLLYANEEFSKITGYTKEEVLGKNCKFLQGDDQQIKKINVIKEGIKKRKKIQVELRNYKKDGTLFYNLLSIAPVYSKENQLINFVEIQKDKTNLKKREAHMAEQAKLASMGEMITNIAHQWRQPLSVISTAATGMQLQREFGLLKDSDFDKTCNAINENVQYLSKTIDDFKNLVQDDSPKKYFNLTKVINNFLSLISGTTTNDQITVVVNLDDSIEINGYENELNQCFMNIFNNARDALLKQTNRLFFIESYMKNKKVVIRLKDNAGGIPETFINKVFEPYFTTKHQFQGTGLGLHMTYNLIEEGMKGRIKVKNSNFNYKNLDCNGAEFLIILPYL